MSPQEAVLFEAPATSIEQNGILFDRIGRPIEPGGVVFDRDGKWFEESGRRFEERSESIDRTENTIDRDGRMKDRWNRVGAASAAERATRAAEAAPTHSLDPSNTWYIETAFAPGNARIKGDAMIRVRQPLFKLAAGVIALVIAVSASFMILRVVGGNVAERSARKIPAGSSRDAAHSILGSYSRDELRLDDVVAGVKPFLGPEVTNIERFRRLWGAAELIVGYDSSSNVKVVIPID